MQCRFVGDHQRLGICIGIEGLATSNNDFSWKKMEKSNKYLLEDSRYIQSSSLIMKFRRANMKMCFK